MESNSKSKIYIYHLSNGFSFNQYTELKDLDVICKVWRENTNEIQIGRYLVQPKDLICIEQSMYE